MTPEIAAALRDIGAQIDPPATAAIYAPLHANLPDAGVTPRRDLRYGSHERHVLDLWSAAEPGAARPVLVFVHGGGFQRGAKSAEGSPFYDNIMRWSAEQAYVGVNINYRLAPEHRWPSGVEDLTGVIAWLRANVAEYGGDPQRIVLWGHSAGAGHVADYIAEHERDGADNAIRGAILMSGMYALGTEISIWQAYYGDDVGQYPRRSALPMLSRTATPLMVVDAELDPHWALEQAGQLADALEAAGAPLTRLHLAGHSHISESYAIGTNDRSLSTPVKRFIETMLAEKG